MNACQHPPDVTLLLRAHSEQRWLSREVIPVVRQLETGQRLPEEQLPAARAYLEVVWVEAVGRAREADAALRRLDPPALEQQSLPAKARRYHASVQSLREAVAWRVAVLVEQGMLVETGTRTAGECLPDSPAAPADYAEVASSACSR